MKENIVLNCKEEYHIWEKLDFHKVALLSYCHIPLVALVLQNAYNFEKVHGGKNI